MNNDDECIHGTVSEPTIRTTVGRGGLRKALRQFDAAVDWALDRLLALDPDAHAHFWHLADGEPTGCCTSDTREAQ